MSDWTEAAVDTAIRAHQAQQAATGSTTVRVSAATKAELLEIQQEFAADHPRATISLDGIIARMLADRRAWRAMGEAAREADRKPVPS